MSQPESRQGVIMTFRIASQKIVLWHYLCKCTNYNPICQQQIGFLAYKLKKMGFRENLKSELTYSGMLVKELAAKSGVSKHSLDCYLNARGQIPSVEVGVKLAKALGVSVEYLVTGEEGKQTKTPPKMSGDTWLIAQIAEQLNDKQRKFLIDFIKWLKSRKNHSTHEKNMTTD